MTGTKLLSLQVSDIVQWYREGTLVINETFQRRSVWNRPAQSFLIDTILCGLPIPKLYIRTTVDPATQRSVREVVDGQQRIRAIVAFANDELKLTKRSEFYNNLRYSDLDDDVQSEFLGYTLTVEQLLNASDEVVLEMFARLNSYTVTLNDAEKRHAEFQTDFKWLVRRTAKKWGDSLVKHKIISLQQRFRMYDDELAAEAYRLIVKGVRDGGAPKLRQFYRDLSDIELKKLKPRSLQRHVNDAFQFAMNTCVPSLSDPLRQNYVILAAIAAYLHSHGLLPQGDIKPMPKCKPLASTETIRSRLRDFSADLEDANPSKKTAEYLLATRKTSPQRIAARRVRFKKFCNLLFE